MTAIRSISTQAPTIEALRLLVGEAGIADLALASTPRLDGVVGDWGAFRAVDISVDVENDRTASYHTLDGFAAMDFDLELHRIDGRPLGVTVTVTASEIGGTARIMTVDPARVLGAPAGESEPAAGYDAEDFIGTSDGIILIEAFRHQSPDAAAHFDGFGLGMSDIRAITVTATAEGLARGFVRNAQPNPFDDVYVFEAGVTVGFGPADGGTVETDFDALVSVTRSDDLLMIHAIDFLPSEPTDLPAARNAPLGSQANPVVVEGVVDRDPAEDAVIVKLLGLGMGDIAHHCSPMLDVAIGGFDGRPGEWKDIVTAALSPVRGTLWEGPDHVEIVATLNLTDTLGTETEHAVNVRLKRDGGDLIVIGLALRSVVKATGPADAAAASLDAADAQGRALIDAIERLDRTSLWTVTTVEVDNAIGHWSEIERSSILVDCGTLARTGDETTVIGTLTADTTHGDRIERPVLCALDKRDGLTIGLLF